MIMWTRERLEEAVRTKMSDYHMVVVSNRQPYAHVRKSGKVVCQRQPGGLVTALNPVMAAVGGTWIATGVTHEDRAVLDAQSKVKVTDAGGAYDLKRLFLSKEDADAYYYGYCNEGLWPLSHITYTRPHFSFSDWEAYQRVNRVFAEQVLAEVQGRKAFVWVQDFHLALVAKYLREAGASNIVTSLFWHIPWPNPEVFRICPQKKEILEGLLAYDLLGFQIRYHEDNFLSAVDRELEARIDRERTAVHCQGRETLVRSFPISVDFDAITQESASDFEKARDRLTSDFSLSGRKVLVSVDRIDYTKGIPDKLRAFDRFLEKYPEYQGKAVFFQLGQISRIHIPSYKQINDEINDLVNRINWKYSTDDWVPVILTRTYISYSDILTLYRLADACLVGSLHDGMNLVAKEFVASRSDLQGALVLSQFTGAARELTDAFLVNPYDHESFADTLFSSLSSPEKELERRMKKMREVVSGNNIYRWAGKVMSQLLKFEFQDN